MTWYIRHWLANKMMMLTIWVLPESRYKSDLVCLIYRLKEEVETSATRETK